MALEKIQVPDLGDSEEVEVIEILVNPGDEVSENDSLLVLESDKAAMEIPSPASGVVKELLVKVGDQVKEGVEIVAIETTGGDAGTQEDETPQEQAPEAEAPAESEPQAAATDKVEESSSTSGGTAIEEIKVPDLGEDSDVDVIDILVAEGDEIQAEDGLITLETDKAAMDVPAPKAGKVVSIKLKVGDKVSEGSLILELETEGSAKPAAAPAKSEEVAKAPAPAQEEKPAAEQKPVAQTADETITAPSTEVYAGPAVRKLARELGVDLSLVKGSGTKNRILKEDVQDFVKSVMKEGAAVAAPASGGAGIPGIKDIDFSKFGEIEEVSMSKLHQVTSQNMSRNWLNVPHVTQFDEADVTDLEDFRAAQKALAEKKGVKLTPVPFIVKACARALQEYPQFNVSLHSSGTKLIQKKYVNIGVAVATPAGLMVPVIKNADQKSIWEIAAEVAELGAKAKDRKLSKEDMEGGCFTVSSLGGLGGNGFTPIVNAPEVAILGVSKTQVKPVYVNGEFVPRKMLPYCLSYDHRAVNGVDGGKFSTYLNQLLSDIRMMVL